MQTISQSRPMATASSTGTWRTSSSTLTELGTGSMSIGPVLVLQGRDERRTVVVVQSHDHADLLVEVGDQPASAQLVERRQRQHDPAVGIVAPDERHDAAPDHLDAPLATGSAHRRLVADSEVERPHRARADGDLVRAGRRPALEDGQPHRAGESLETHRRDLADRAVGTAQVDLAAVHRLDAGDTRLGRQPLAASRCSDASTSTKTSHGCP